MSSFTIRPATAADADAIGQVHYDALDTYHDFYAAFFERHPREWLSKSNALALREPETNRYLVAVDGETGRVVGFVRFKFEASDEDKEAANKEVPSREDEERPVEETPPTFAVPKAHMKGLWEQFNERQKDMDACYKDAIKGQRHMFVWHLMIDPAYQRRGIGKSLLERALAESDAQGLPAMIVSSAESHGLYLKVGFEDLRAWTIDNGLWAEKIAQHERELGIGGSEGLAERFKGVTEVEHYMVRRRRMPI